MATPPIERPIPTTHEPAPKSILIIGAGVFGLSTTHALLSSPRYNHTTITLLDPYLPSLDPPPPPPPTSDPLLFPQSQNSQAVSIALSQNPHAASIDSSRIIRADYANPAYARLASAAQAEWRQGFGRADEKDAEELYRECGLVLTADRAGSEYLERSCVNARDLGGKVEALGAWEDVRRVFGAGVGRGVGEMGYVNWSSGWVDAGGAMKRVMALVVAMARERNIGRMGEGEGRVVFKRAKATNLLFDKCADEQRSVKGACLDTNEDIAADLTILAAGACSGALLDLSDRAEARGQVLTYVSLSPVEARSLNQMPVLLNLSSGLFIVPPARDPASGEWVLKVARHAYGYKNPTPVSPEGKPFTTSLPSSSSSTLFSHIIIPPEGEQACRTFLRHAIPWLGERPFCAKRLCWYTDTPTGDFLVTYHPYLKNCFLATGGSGHAFKFLPVIGEKVVMALEGVLEGELEALWGWREGDVRGGFEGCEDGSRGGGRGMVLREEMERGMVLREEMERGMGMGRGKGEGEGKSML